MAPRSGAAAALRGRGLSWYRCDSGPGTPLKLAMPPKKTRLPFNVVDEAIFHLDSVDEPWSIHLEVHLGGRLDTGRLQESLQKALLLHPLARARREASRSTDMGYVWAIPRVPPGVPLQLRTCADEAALSAVRDRLLGSRVPVDKGPPLSVILVRCPDGDRLIFNICHVAGDGMGSLRLLRSVARAYAGKPDPVPRIDLEEVHNLTERLSNQSVRVRMQRVAELVRMSAHALVSPPSRVAREGTRDRLGYGCCLRRLTAKETASLRPKQRYGATINDLLLAALHRTIARWNRLHDKPCDRIGVMMPLNLRSPGRIHEVFCNLSLFVSVSSVAADRQDAGRLMAAISRQTSLLKKGAGAALIEVLAGSPFLPVGIKRSLTALIPLTRERFVESANLSNLGRIEGSLSFGKEAGGEPRALWFSPPCKMPIGISLGAMTHAGRLHLGMRYRPSIFGSEAACRFMDLYVESLFDLG